MTTITKNFEGRSLTLVEDYSQLNWETYPILLSDGERKAIDFPYVVSVLKGTVRSPLTKAEISLDTACPILLEIERVFSNTMRKFKEDSLEPQRQDWARIRELDPSRPFYTSIFVNLYRLIFGSAYIHHEGSCHRKLWLNSIHILEKERINNMGTLVRTRLETLIYEASLLQVSGEISLSLNKEVKQLRTFGITHFTNEEWFCNLSPQIQAILSVENIHENGV